MSGLKLYFVAVYKHDSVQNAVAGPFIDYATADTKLNELDPSYPVNRLVVCHVNLPFQLEEGY